MLLEGKTALITGASRGIGREIARRFIEEGAEVWGLATKPSEGAKELASFAEQKGTGYHELIADIGDAGMVQSVISQAVKDSGGFSILVNNAGITRDGLSFRMKLEDWNDVLRINLTGTFLVSQIVSADMIRKRAGSIINLSSIVGLHGQGGQVNYAASKAGIIGYTKSLAKETAGRGVRVNAIAPGFIITEMTEVIPEEAKKVWLESIPMKRAGTVTEVADAAVFLASDLSTYITAQVIGIDGGMGA
ncbi:3-oxoacyl-[acyl-carrier-protein] reductase [Brucepastera parasyntrophica]|uniref:3-oxoacyl-[acyl-carrier-protein] reductase n=1 Tax=Brucepastera parasyntrophica TaxID=2880008 RepID=UPI00210897D0|nr:3-oxoacyl-[acyl-carrier-protein] reductase [Brucepastera parasyntrophica]ULQ60794.1 3-oxoacyl-[acyl-carrier-protein] reductase [Brucepastera parasyntrophica]